MKALQDEEMRELQRSYRDSVLDALGAPAQIQPRWGCMLRGCGEGTAA